MDGSPPRILRSAVLPADPEAVPAFEDWLDTIPPTRPSLGNRIRLAGGEILDNIVRHSRPAGGLIRVRLRASGDSARLSFSFRSESFRDFVRNGPDARNGSIARTAYDPGSRRWRGLGLVMIARLTDDVRYRSGWPKDRIVAEFRDFGASSCTPGTGGV